MDPMTAGIVITVFLVVILASGLWIGMALAAAGYVAMAFFTSRPPGLIFGSTLWGSNNSWALTALPLFIWMGEILFRTRLAEDMFRGLSPWVQRIPGRLLHTNVIGCAIFAAISGSSAATAATIGKMTVPELRSRGYGDFMIVGSLAGSGTLGLLIPPSIMMIVYGVAAQVSIGRLFIAGIIPGLLLMLIFSAIVAGYALMKPDHIPAREPRLSLKAKLWESRRLIPVSVLIILVLGCIYGGIATPTEAASIGVAGSLALALLSGGLDLSTFWGSVMAATRTSAMIGLILSGAAFLSTAMGFTGLPEQFATWIIAMNLPQPALLAALVCIFLVMGCFIDGISMIVLTTSVLLPAVQSAGLDLLWFGIFVVLLVEIAQITPPVGFNLYVLQSLANRSIGYIALAALPFFLGLLVLIVLITLAPDVVMWLPAQMLGQSG
ncbi:TRAP transporter large permease [Rhizobium halophytocola]|uniref:TRAP transporter large permease protein n=1 Tax=Rhizobium halophytocola TaxID=735519 RepID=A0ABS4DT16_9HYPH|nr:TRAP transporter large permease subunit [Rhizobium halophytocola]MBP1848825.1 tripartite ATP-independent transporter DctM subunit [Rhizobium halophytocola]